MSGAPARTAPRELYLYWRTRADALDAALAGVAAWQATLATAHAGLECRLLVRTDAGAPTVMEIYRCTGGVDGIDAALEARLRDEGAALVAPWCDGRRHVEVFAPVALR